MSLEEIALTYGMVDYLDSRTNKIYHLSEAKESKDNNLLVPVSENREIIGYASMKKLEDK